jgi:hypothetical protein
VEYKVTLLDRATREAQIEQSIVASNQKEEFHDFRGARTELPVIRIPIDLPVYRMENFRTFSDQAEFLARERKEFNFFWAGQENESTQQIQHELLAKLAAKGKASSVTPVIEVLAREGQRETLLITRSGVVVNGNRRLAGMRELYADGSGTYQQFSHVNCKVLPADTTPNDILEIEAILQARPETRLDYDWIGDAQLLKAMLRTKGKVDDVAKLLNRKAPEVRNSLQALTEAEIYLKDWAKAEGEYSRVAEDGKQLFKDLPGELNNKPPSLQEASRAVAWTLFENRNRFEGRVYNYNVAFGKRAEDVLNRLAEDLGISLDNESAGSDEGFEFDLGNDRSGSDYQPIINALRDDTRKAEAVDALVEICVSIVESERDKKSESAALKAITAANAKLAEVDLSRAGRNTYDAIERQLAAVIQRATELKARVDKFRNEAAAPAAPSIVANGEQG